MEEDKGISNERWQEPLTREQKSETQQTIDRQLQSPELRDMHLESGEKINEYEV